MCVGVAREKVSGGRGKAAEREMREKETKRRECCEAREKERGREMRVQL